jgi:hypothetical protein
MENLSAMESKNRQTFEASLGHVARSNAGFSIEPPSIGKSVSPAAAIRLLGVSVGLKTRTRGCNRQARVQWEPCAQEDQGHWPQAL